MNKIAFRLLIAASVLRLHAGRVFLFFFAAMVQSLSVIKTEAIPI